MACALAMTMACTTDGRRVDDEGDGVATLRPADEPGSVGTSGEADQAHGATADARHFVEKAGIAGAAEVKLGQLAMEHAQSSQVKEFAQMMVRDHSKAGNELKQAVSRHNVSMPTALDDEHQRLYDRLSKLHGSEFDREYMQAMVDGHMKVESLIESRTRPQSRADRSHGATGTTGTTADTQLDVTVNQWANKALPTVEQHLQKAQQIRATLDRK
jgi:putative membrane protein